MKQQLIAFYMDWCNNFLTITRMAEYYGLTVREVELLIGLGEKYNEEAFRHKRKEEKQGA